MRGRSVSGRIPNDDVAVAAAAAGALTVLALAAADLAWGRDQIITATFVLGPFLTGLLASVRATAAVAALAVLLAVVTSLLNEVDVAPQILRVLVVVLGGGLAIAGARARERAARLRRDNVGLSDEVAAAERRLIVALDTLDAAVLVQRPGRGIVYANQATADMMGMPTAEAVMTATPEEIAVGWESFEADGTPLRAERYPSRRLLMGESSVEPLLVRAVNRATGREHWRVVKASPIVAPDGTLEMTVSITEDVTDIKRGDRAGRLLAEAAEALASPMDPEATLQQVADLVVPELADWCSVLVPGARGTLRLAAVAHSDPDRVAFARRYHERFPVTLEADSGAALVLRTAEAQLHDDVTDEMLEAAVEDREQLEALREIGVRSAVLVPIIAPGADPLGVLTLVQAESGRRFRTEDLALAQEIGRRAGTVVQNARLHHERRVIAETLQASLMPPALRGFPGLDVVTSYLPAGEHNLVGGDFYDLFDVPGGRMAIIGDVTGQGAAAAALTARARHTLRAVATLTGDPSATLAHLNDLLVAADDLSLCTAAAVLLSTEDDGRLRAHVARGGHPPAVHVHAGEAVEVAVDGPLLGAWPAEFPVTERVLDPGDLLVLYTDGLIDATDGERRFGSERVLEVLAGATGAQDALDRLLAALADQTAADDIAILVLESVTGAA